MRAHNLQWYVLGLALIVFLLVGCGKKISNQSEVIDAHRHCEAHFKTPCTMIAVPVNQLDACVGAMHK